MDGSSRVIVSGLPLSPRLSSLDIGPGTKKEGKRAQTYLFQ